MIVCGLGISVVGNVEFLMVIMMLLVRCRCFRCVIDVVGDSLSWIILLWLVGWILCVSYCEFGLKLWCLSILLKFDSCDSGFL